jgi:hypothetical protein
MKKYLIGVIIVLSILLLFFIRKSNKPIQYREIRDTITVVKIDTIRINKPIYIKERVIDTILVPIFDTLRLNDTLYQPIVKTQKYYTKDSVYQAWVSGYRPTLDSINVFQKNVTETVTIRVPQKKWGVAAIGGYGVGKNGLSPYVGVGLYYRIW